MFHCLTQLRCASFPDTDAEFRVGSQCFNVRGVPMLRLSCPPTSDGHPTLIHVRRVFYGVPPPTTWSSKSNQTNPTSSSPSNCVFQSSERHCVQLGDLPPGHRCNGRQQCIVHVSNPYLLNCRQYAVYMQINYTCSPCMYPSQLMFWMSHCLDPAQPLLS